MGEVCCKHTRHQERATEVHVEVGKTFWTERQNMGGNQNLRTVSIVSDLWMRHPIEYCK